MAKMRAQVEGSVRGSYGKPWSTLAGIPVTPKMMSIIGKCMAKVFAEEAVRDFRKRGWSVRDPMKGSDLGKSFGYKLKGRSTVEVTCTFYGVARLANEDIPEHPMPWLTQQAHGTLPKKIIPGKKTVAGISGSKRPLVVPIQTDGGVIFRMAPLTTDKAWIHPGIAKFTFVNRAVKRAREECLKVLRDAAADALRAGNPLG